MSFEESAMWFRAEEDSLLGIVARPNGDSDSRNIGVVIVVGGPQYRAGSHRQFTLLARRLASEGFPTLRFDYRGLGDSTGEPRPFTQLEEDIGAAIESLKAAAGVRAVVLWGLCDAASAALLAVPRRSDVAGLVLVNPWVSDTNQLAALPVSYYYGARLRDPAFWRKLMGGKVELGASIRSLAKNGLAAIRKFVRRPGHRNADSAPRFQTAMASGWRSFSGPILVALSGVDFTSREFLEYAGQDKAWKGLLEQPRVSRWDLAEADHTFSSAEWRGWLERHTLEWLTHVPVPPRQNSL